MYKRFRLWPTKINTKLGQTSYDTYLFGKVNVMHTFGHKHPVTFFLYFYTSSDIPESHGFFAISYFFVRYLIKK